MILLVTSDNFFQLFLGWEGVGISSYLLINFWFTRTAANQSAIKAIIVNRFGDVGILIAMLSIFNITKSLEFGIFFSQLNNLQFIYFQINNLEIHALTFISFFIFIGSVGKSAQMGLHTWLPDAMEGPTPVSALIHAATMVTAGIFVLIRLSLILEYSTVILVIIAIIGALTAFFAGTIGIFQNDLKRVIAYSTCSQLGYMMVGCGLSSYSVALFHLMNHAFFKALLFLSAGAIIHSMLDQQDVRRMGMLLKYLPVSYLMILIGSLTIMGVPFLTGFYSKDFILEYVYSSNISLNFFLYTLSILSACLTSFYSIKLLFLTFYNTHNSYFNVLYNKKQKTIFIHESNVLILIALIILFIGSIFIGFIFKDLFIGMGTDI